MANTFVQATADTANQVTATPAITFPGNVAIGNLLVVSYKRDATGTLNTMTDNMGVGNSWTTVFDFSYSTFHNGWAWVFSKGSGPCTVTAGLSASQNTVMACAEWNGPNAFRLQSGQNNGSNSTGTTLAYTPTVGDLIVGIFANNGGSGTATPGGGAVTVKRASATAAGAIWLVLSDKLSAAGGSQSAAMTWSTTFTLQSSVGVFWTNPALLGGGWVNRHRAFVTKR